MDQLTTTVRHQSWTQMIQAQKASGLSIKQWCLENHISENCFFYRQRRLRDCAGEALHQFVEGREGGFEVALCGDEGVELLAGGIDSPVVFVLTEVQEFTLLFLYLLHVGTDGLDFLADFLTEHIAAVAALDGYNLFG